MEEETKKVIKEYENDERESTEQELVFLLEYLEEKHPLLKPDRCMNCGTFMDGHHDNTNYNADKNKWDNQRCECCPMCNKACTMEDEELVSLTLHIWREGGAVCEDCKDEYEMIRKHLASY